MGEKYLIDTNAISDYLGGRLPINGLDFMDEIIDDSPSISIINQIELIGQNSSDIHKFQLFVESCTVYMLTNEIVSKTIALRKSRSIKIPDAIIAATALVHDLTLITHNISDFKGIQNLRLIDPHTI